MANDLGRNKAPDQSWRRFAFPVQVRVWTTDGTGWALYSRHREWGDAQKRATTEAQNQFSGRVDVVDIRDEVEQ